MTASAYVFDLDGTLTDPKDGIMRCVTDALMAMGVELPEPPTVAQCIGPPLHTVFADILGGAGRVDEAVAAFRQRYATEGLFENRLYPGIVEMLADLHRLAPALYVATSKPHAYAVRIVEHFGLWPYFRRVHGAEIGGERSDKVELLAHLIDVEGIAPAQSVMIGDRKHDILAARAHGMDAVGVTWGYGSADELRQAGATTLCNSAAELSAWFRRRV